MSELSTQGALDWWEANRRLVPLSHHGQHAMTLIVDTAKKYANPDYEAAAMERHRNGRPKCYEGPKEDGCYCWDTTKRAVQTALGMEVTDEG